MLSLPLLSQPPSWYLVLDITIASDGEAPVLVSVEYAFITLTKGAHLEVKSASLSQADNTEVFDYLTPSIPVINLSC